jgi:hypothetical protein
MRNPEIMGFQPGCITRPAATFVNYVYSLLYKSQNYLSDYVYHLLLFFHARPANQPTITGVVLYHKIFGHP